jgi:hypothetical protein
MKFFFCHFEGGTTEKSFARAEYTIIYGAGLLLVDL